MSASDAHVIWRGLLIEAREVKVRRASSGSAKVGIKRRDAFRRNTSSWLNLGSASRSEHVTSVQAEFECVAQ